MEHFIVLPKTDINSNAPQHQQRAVFQSYLSDYIKEDAATTTAHRKRLISLLKGNKLLTTSLITI